MIDFFSPNSKALLPKFCTNCPDGSHFAQMAHETRGLILPRWGLSLPRMPPPTPVLYSAFTLPFWGYIRTQNTPNPTPNTPFPLKVGKMNLIPSRQNETPTGQYVWKVDKTFLEVGKKSLFIYLNCRWAFTTALSGSASKKINPKHWLPAQQKIKSAQQQRVATGESSWTHPLLPTRNDSLLD